MKVEVRSRTSKPGFSGLGYMGKWVFVQEGTLWGRKSKFEVELRNPGFRVSINMVE
uniref:Uncharacterized protein n=1 Tax=Meloidogyne incognita TaxID=6306 RepID=A0A914NT46_MELIC